MDGTRLERRDGERNASRNTTRNEQGMQEGVQQTRTIFRLFMNGEPESMILKKQAKVNRKSTIFYTVPRKRNLYLS